MKLLTVLTVGIRVGLLCYRIIWHSHPCHSTLGEETVETAQLSVCPRDFAGLGLGLLMVPFPWLVHFQGIAVSVLVHRWTCTRNAWKLQVNLLWFVIIAKPEH